MMITQKDLQQLNEKGISFETFNEQLVHFVQGFPFLKIRKAAEIKSGITVIEKQELNKLIELWENYLTRKKLIVKFVPASGAASRMFKDLFEFQYSEKSTPSLPFEITFFNEIKRFAFYINLNNCCIKNEGKDIDALISAAQHKIILANLLDKRGLNYGSLPKGLLKFHQYDKYSRTPLEEHLVEGALYAKSGNKVYPFYCIN